MAVNCTVGDDLTFKPPCFIYITLFTLLCSLIVLSSGCGPTVRQSAGPSREAQHVTRRTTDFQPDFSMAYANAMENTPDLPLEKIRRHIAEEAILEEDSPFEHACHEGELVGPAACIMSEPRLSEDPLIEENCADSARSWCDPSHEKRYLSYLEQRDVPAIQIQTAILPYFSAPVKDGLVLRGMQLPQHKRQRGHYGIDVIPRQCKRRGVPLQAIEDGIVVISSWGRGYGYYVVMYHQNGLFSLYSHTLKQSRARVGQVLNRGDTLAYMGKSGNAKGYHLHFELIDLREHWNFRHSMDTFIQRLAEGRPLGSCSCEQLKTLLFAKKSKKNPLQYIEGLTLAKRQGGKWIAGEAIIPMTRISIARTNSSYPGPLRKRPRP
ncbi:hypothetical protein CSB45_06420 [candidate division KSB3 bacterium]|uniref:M23ase beta-sheet core domain-containing protein n=1 Tax=candidate division KSB3 bacterium TaxID=2044937 RepID=A0A2G6E6Y5_9BACT|nr:MAG: hypothetical protein CSB45_06420 [candidate division KSB3 bacterium]PIE30275.1 MAG: hypothetical protein CSA57_05135 [candidate division KSB3 bacterium]